MNTITNELLDKACPSIRYRMRSEILGEAASSPGMKQIQNEILKDAWVQKVIHWQQADGWIGRDFHGENSMETGIRVLCEKGVEKTHPVIAKAMKVLSTKDERLNRGIGKAGIALDEQNLGGTQIIQATVFAYAGIENSVFVQDQIQKAVDSFQTLAGTQSIQELITTHKGKMVFKPGIVWPSIYHLRLLAFTQSWRTRENLVKIAEGIRQFVNLSPIPYILLKYKSQLVAPASFCMLDFNPDMDSMDNVGWMMWFHRMEILARIGICHTIPELKNQITRLQEILSNHQGRFPIKLNHYYFRKWSPYSGLMLETDWKNSDRRIYDLTFRSLLIIHYFNKYL